MSKTRLTVGQALIRFLAAQYSERDGVEHRLIEGCFGIFGHGNLAGVAEALLESELARPGEFRYYQARNEQAMVHTACGFARMRNRLSTLRLLVVCRTRGDEHGDRGGDGDGQPDPSAAPTLGRLRDAAPVTRCCSSSSNSTDATCL